MAAAQLAYNVPQADGSMRRPPVVRSATGFSGRRFCKIFPDGKGWALQLMDVGWAANEERTSCASRRCQPRFPTPCAMTILIGSCIRSLAIYTLQPRKDSPGRRARRSA